jgi:hypothetical protein
MPPRSRSLRIPAGALVALALAILLAGFLLGRRASPVATPAPTSAPVSAETQPVAPAPTLETAPAFGAPAAVPSAEPPPDTVPTITMPAISLPAASPAAAAPSAEVARYFEEADAVEARAKYWSDPQALAKTILEQATSGNTGAFDDLVRAQTNARDELARISVPAECAEHHRRSLAVMAQGIGLLERVRSALGSGDVAALEGLQESASALEREAKAIDELGRKLRSR